MEEAESKSLSEISLEEQQTSQSIDENIGSTESFHTPGQKLSPPAYRAMPLTFGLSSPPATFLDYSYNHVNQDNSASISTTQGQAEQKQGLVKSVSGSSAPSSTNPFQQLKNIANNAKEALSDSSHAGKSAFSKWISAGHTNHISDNNNPSAPVFGRSISECPLDVTDCVPFIIVKCIDYLKMNCLDLVGLFRVPGSQSEIRRIRELFDRHQPVDFENLDIMKTPHSVAAILKLYLRELPEPLITFEYYHLFIAANSTPEPVARLESFRKLLHHIPPLNLCTLIYLLKFLSLVADRSAENKMTIANLAMVFAPNLLRDKDADDLTGFQDTGSATKIIETLLEQFDYLFQDFDWSLLVQKAKQQSKSSQSSLNLDKAASEKGSKVSLSGGEKDSKSQIKASFAENQQKLIHAIKKFNTKVKDSINNKKSNDSLNEEFGSLEDIETASTPPRTRIAGPRPNPFEEAKSFESDLKKGIKREEIILGSTQLRPFNE